MIINQKINKKNGIAFVTLVITIIILVLLTSVGMGIIINKKYFGKAEDMKFNSNFENYRNELIDYIENEEFLSGARYNQEELFADKNGIYYGEQKIDGKTIKDIIVTMDDEYLDTIKVYKGTLIYVGGTKDYQKNVNITTNYIKDSLIGLYDSYKNDGIEFNTTSNIWKDLNLSGNDMTIANTDTWRDNSLLVNNINGGNATNVILSENIPANSSFSIEVVYKELSHSYNLAVESFLYSNGFLISAFDLEGNLYAGINQNDSSRLGINDFTFKTRINVVDKITYTYNGESKKGTIYINAIKMGEKVFSETPATFNTINVKGNRQYYSLRIYKKCLNYSEVMQNDVCDVLNYGTWIAL